MIENLLPQITQETDKEYVIRELWRTPCRQSAEDVGDEPFSHSQSSSMNLSIRRQQNSTSDAIRPRIYPTIQPDVQRLHKDH